MVSIWWVVGVGIAAFLVGVVSVPRHAVSGDDRRLTAPDLVRGMEDWFLVDVQAAIARGREKHPGNSHMLVALMEEVGELARALLENQGTKRVWQEAVDVAVVASRIALEGDGDFEVELTPPPVVSAPMVAADDSDWSDLPSRARVGGAV